MGAHPRAGGSPAGRHLSVLGGDNGEGWKAECAVGMSGAQLLLHCSPGREAAVTVGAAVLDPHLIWRGGRVDGIGAAGGLLVSVVRFLFLDFGL